MGSHPRAPRPANIEIRISGCLGYTDERMPNGDHIIGIYTQANRWKHLTISPNMMGRINQYLHHPRNKVDYIGVFVDQYIDTNGVSVNHVHGFNAGNIDRIPQGRPANAYIPYVPA